MYFLVKSRNSQQICSRNILLLAIYAPVEVSFLIRFQVNFDKVL